MGALNWCYLACFHPKKSKGEAQIGCFYSSFKRSDLEKTFNVLCLLKVRVQFNKDGVSYIHSDNDHDVHFTGIKVSDVNEKSAGKKI